jgi:hypothetical protein
MDDNVNLLHRIKCFRPNPSYAVIAAVSAGNFYHLFLRPKVAGYQRMILNFTEGTARFVPCLSVRGALWCPLFKWPAELVNFPGIPSKGMDKLV